MWLVVIRLIPGRKLAVKGVHMSPVPHVGWYWKIRM